MKELITSELLPVLHIQTRKDRYCNDPDPEFVDKRRLLDQIFNYLGQDPDQKPDPDVL
jgi:hypothetical protein